MALIEQTELSKVAVNARNSPNFKRSEVGLSLPVLPVQVHQIQVAIKFIGHR